MKLNPISQPSQSLRVMSFIEKSVARLDQPERLEALAVELGKSHYHYNAPPKYYNVRPSDNRSNQKKWQKKREKNNKIISIMTSAVSNMDGVFQYVGTEFICAVQPILKERWTAKLEEAWKVKWRNVLNEWHKQLGLRISK